MALLAADGRPAYAPRMRTVIGRRLLEVDVG
jgi:hypothetical protein